MADPNQMNRTDLLETRKRVTNQLRILQTRSVGFPTITATYKSRDDLVSELNQILDEINYELEHPSA